MNPDSPKPSRDEIEARLTALLLGELSAEEATLLNWMIGQDAELAKLHERLKLTIDLTREAVTAEKTEAATAQTEPLKLSDARREKLLVQFKTVKPVEFVPRKRRQVSTLVAVAAILTLMGLLAAMLLPSLAAAKRKSLSIAAKNEARTENLEQLMHEEAIATGGPLPKDNVQSEKPVSQQKGAAVYSQNVVGYVDVKIPEGSFQMLGDTLTVSKSPEDRRRELANSIVLPKAETDPDQLGTMATASEATLARPMEQPAAFAPLKLALATDEGLGRSSESLREPAQSESQPQHFFRLGLPDSDGNEVANVRSSEVQVASVAHGANPAAGAGTSPNDFTSNIRSITAKSATGALEQRRTQAAQPQTVGGTTSSKLGRVRRQPDENGGQQAIAPAQVGASGNFTASEVYTARFYDSPPASELNQNGVKQDGFNLNLNWAEAGSANESTRGSGFTSIDSLSDSIANQAGVDNALQAGLRTTTSKDLEKTELASVTLSAPQTLDGTVNGPANQPDGIGGGGGRGGRGGGGSFGGGGFGGAGGGGGGAAGDGRAGGRAAGRGGRGGVAPGAGGPGGTPAEVAAQNNVRQYGTASFSVDPNTHQIIVNSDASTYQQVQEAIKNLDSTPKPNNSGDAPVPLITGVAYTTSGNQQIPILGDSPTVGRLFRSETQSSGNDVVASPLLPPPSGEPTTPSIAQAVSDALLTGGLRDNLPTPAETKAKLASSGLVSGDSWRSFDGSTAAPVVSPNSTRISDLEGQVVNAGGTLALNGRNAVNGGTFVNNGTLVFQDRIEDSSSGLTRDDVGGNRYLLSVNNGTIEAGNGGTPAAANPEGTAIIQAATDGDLTSGSRNSINAPAVGTITGVLTDPQFRVAVRTVEQRKGELAQNDNRALGFDWSLGNERMSQGQGNVGVADGSAQQNSSARFRNAIIDIAANNNSPMNLGDEYRKNGEMRYYSSDANGFDNFSPQVASEAVKNAYDVLSKRDDKLGTAESPRSASGEKVSATKLVQDGKLMLEMGKPAEAESKLKEAIGLDPQNASAFYYEKLAIEAKYAAASKRRNISASQNLVKVEKNWENPVSRDSLPVPNQMVTNFTVSLGNGQQATADEAKQKLDALEVSSKVLAMKIQAESLDRSIPQTASITLVDPAKPEAVKSPSLLNRLTGKLNTDYESVARIQLARSQPDTSSMESQPQPFTYDPNFIDSEAEVIKSDRVLNKAIENLKLDDAWKTKSAEEQKVEIAKARELLKKNLDVESVKGTSLLDIKVKSGKPEEAAKMANAVAQAYGEYRAEVRAQLSGGGIKAMEEQYIEQQKKIAAAKTELAQLEKPATQPVTSVKEEDLPLRRVSTNAPIPQPEILASENNFSTFSLNVSDVSFKLAAASLEKGQLPDAASIRTEEFINAFNYRDPEPPAGMPVAFASERARYPFAHNRELLRFSIKTAAQGRQAGRPMNLVLLLDNSGSMERADRVAIIQQALRVLASKLQPEDSISITTFARTPRLWVDGVAGDKARESLDQVGGITPEGGTNLEEAMKLAYETALRHYLANGANRVVLLTDGAANLGNVNPEALKEKVESFRKQGVALDCFGIGWEGFNDDLLEQLSSNGDGRYGFINTPEEAATGFAGQLAGALQVAAQDVKVQVEFNPKRVTNWRQIGYAKHQLTKQQFRDNTVDAAEIAAQEAGNALYTVETNPQGEGPVATVRVRYKIPGTTDYREQAWDVAYTGNAPALDQSSPAMRLAATASAFGEWLAQSPFAQEITPDQLLGYLRGVPEICGADARPKQLETMIREAKSLAGK